MSQEIVEAVREIEREKGIEAGTLVAALEDALLAAYKRDYEAKYKRTDTTYLIPPELPAHVIARAHELALAAYTALGCSGHARPDLRITPAGERLFYFRYTDSKGLFAPRKIRKV